jgi:hypothetical protein
MSKINVNNPIVETYGVKMTRIKGTPGLGIVPSSTGTLR